MGKYEAAVELKICTVREVSGLRFHNEIGQTT